MAKKYIEADTLMDKMWQVCGEDDTEFKKGRVKWESGLWLRYKVFEQTVSKIPAADVRENVRGEWIYKDGKTCCSKCFSPYGVRYEGENSFCPNCGADMRGEK